MQVGSDCITHCVHDLAPVVASVLVLVPVLACAWHPCLAVFPAEDLPVEAVLVEAASVEVVHAEQALFALPFSDSVAALSGYADGNGNSADEVLVAA